MENHLEILINKFLLHELSAAESKELETLLAQPENLRIFRDQVEIHFLVQQQQREFDANAAHSKFEKVLKRNEGISWQPFLKYAAVFVVFLGVTFLFWDRSPKTEIPLSDIVYIESETGAIETLNLEGVKQLLDQEGQIIATKNANLITYHKNPKVTELVYNTIRVPFGTLFELVLSDGTQVELNAGTEFKYPVQFIKGKDRQVYLTGEGFFTVSKDSLHPFKVNTSNFDINVLGTQFNVSAYDEDKISSVVLKEGSVNISNDISGRFLSPGERAFTSSSEDLIEIQKVNTRHYTGWRHGISIFHNETFEDISRILERKYNVTIENKYTELRKEIFTATFVEEDIEEILALFSKSRPFKYTISGKKITIEKK